MSDIERFQLERFAEPGAVSLPSFTEGAVFLKASALRRHVERRQETGEFPRDISLKLRHPQHYKQLIQSAASLSVSAPRCYPGD